MAETEPLPAFKLYEVVALCILELLLAIVLGTNERRGFLFVCSPSWHEPQQSPAIPRVRPARCLSRPAPVPQGLPFPGRTAECSAERHPKIRLLEFRLFRASWITLFLPHRQSISHARSLAS